MFIKALLRQTTAVGRSGRLGLINSTGSNARALRLELPNRTSLNHARDSRSHASIQRTGRVSRTRTLPVSLDTVVVITRTGLMTLH